MCLFLQTASLLTKEVFILFLFFYIDRINEELLNNPSIFSVKMINKLLDNEETSICPVFGQWLHSGKHVIKFW